MSQTSHLLSVQDLPEKAIESLLKQSEEFEKLLEQAPKMVRQFHAKTVVLAFFEPSTRTRLSFETAAKLLGAKTIAITTADSSMTKGESLADTFRTLTTMGPDILVLRHKSAGSAQLASQQMQCAIINAGDGTHEHPTQALLDLYTIRKAKGKKLKKLKIGIVGDILHSRVARSNIFLLRSQGAELHLIGPASLVPKELQAKGITLHHQLDEMLPKLDVIMALRIQNERLKESFFPSTKEFAKFYGLNRLRLSKAKPDLIILHPGPVNVGVELSSDVMTDPRCLAEQQVRNGVPVRMAILHKILSQRNLS